VLRKGNKLKLFYFLVIHGFIGGSLKFSPRFIAVAAITVIATFIAGFTIGDASLFRHNNETVTSPAGPYFSEPNFFPIEGSSYWNDWSTVGDAGFAVVWDKKTRYCHKYANCTFIWVTTDQDCLGPVTIKTNIQDSKGNVIKNLSFKRPTMYAFDEKLFELGIKRPQKFKWFGFPTSITCRQKP
jgi:hypothetical protein